MDNSASVTTTTDRSQLKVKYNDLWNHKKHKKRNVYFRVSMVGWSVAIPGLIGLTISTLNDIPGIILFSSAVCFSFGVVLASTVPVDEVTIESIFDKLPLAKILVAGLLSIINLTFGWYSLFYLPYVIWLVQFPLGIVALLYCGCCSNAFSKHTKAIFSNNAAALTAPPSADISSRNIWGLRYFPTFLTLSGLFVLTLFLVFLNNALTGIWNAFGYGAYVFVAVDDDDDDGWPDRNEWGDFTMKRKVAIYLFTYFFLTLHLSVIVYWVRCYISYCCILAKLDWKDDLAVCIEKTYAAVTRLLHETFFAFAGMAILLNWYYCSSEEFILQLFANIVSILPFVIMLCVGKDKYLNTVARLIENDISENIKDGAWMASLASQSNTVEMQVDGQERRAGIRWVVRANCPSQLHKTPADAADAKNRTDRSFHMLGVVEYDKAEEEEATKTFARKEGHVQVCIHMPRDLDHSWHAKFNGEFTEFAPSMSSLYCSGAKAPEEEFRAWVEQHFYSKSEEGGAPKCIISQEHENMIVDNPFVRVQVPLESAKDEADLVAFANSNLRSFELTDSFDDELLLKSPRELKDDAEKDRVFALGQSVDTAKLIHGLKMGYADTRIDFFVSHSWGESKATLLLKAVALRSFAREFKQEHGRFPRVWLDKVCINQKHPGLGISVLPINIMFCRKMLVVVTGSYLARLWCVWELFTLFIFCRKEVAMEKIDILTVEEDGDGSSSAAGASAVDIKSVTTYSRQIHGLEKLMEVLARFSLNDAHAFGQSEEFNLRYILYSIGEDRLEEVKVSIQTVVKRKLERLRAWVQCIRPLGRAYIFVAGTHRVCSEYCRNYRQQSSRVADSSSAIVTESSHDPEPE